MTGQAPAETKPASEAIEETAVEQGAVDHDAVESSRVEHEASASERSGTPDHGGHLEAAAPSRVTGAAAAEQNLQVPSRPMARALAMLRGLLLRLVRPIIYATIAAAALIALGIVFEVLDANTQKWLVSDVESAANWLAAPFQNTFLLHDAKLAIALNWGIAILVYAILGRALVAVTRRAATRLARVH
jgi:hypothetical protein